MLCASISLTILYMGKEGLIGSLTGPRTAYIHDERRQDRFPLPKELDGPADASRRLDTLEETPEASRETD